MEPNHVVGDLQTTVTAFLKGTRRLVTVEKAVAACQSTSTARANVSVGRTAESWKRLAQLHNGSFGQALFQRLTVTRMFDCSGCVLCCFCLWFSAVAWDVVATTSHDAPCVTL